MPEAPGVDAATATEVTHDTAIERARRRGLTGQGPHRYGRLSLWLIGLMVVLAVYFFVPVGRFTLFEHTLRIGAPGQIFAGAVHVVPSEEKEARGRRPIRVASGSPPPRGRGFGYWMAMAIG